MSGAASVVDAIRAAVDELGSLSAEIDSLLTDHGLAMAPRAVVSRAIPGEVTVTVEWVITPASSRGGRSSGPTPDFRAAFNALPAAERQRVIGWLRQQGHRPASAPPWLLRQALAVVGTPPPSSSDQPEPVAAVDDHRPDRDEPPIDAPIHTSDAALDPRTPARPEDRDALAARVNALPDSYRSPCLAGFAAAGIDLDALAIGELQEVGALIADWEALAANDDTSEVESATAAALRRSREAMAR